VKTLLKRRMLKKGWRTLETLRRRRRRILN